MPLITRRSMLRNSMFGGAAAVALPKSSLLAGNSTQDKQAASHDGNSCFSSTYVEARAKFLEAARHNGGSIESHELPGVRGYQGEALFIDLAWFGPPSADVVVLSLSGTHGAEGYVGSAAQVQWLTGRRAASLPAGTAMLMIHGVNPFGFSHMVRFNERSVDLNRNCVDFAGEQLANPLYDKIAADFPRRVGFDEDLVMARDKVVAAAAAKYGEWAVSDALGRGQYSDPTGDEFGGRELQWSIRTLFEALPRLCARARHVVYVDWHSLIPIGDGELVFLCFNQVRDPLYRRVASWWSEKAIDRETVNRQWAAGDNDVRRPSRSGLLMWGVQRALAPHCDVAGAVIEFCCDPDQFIHAPVETSRLFLYERWLYENRDSTGPDRELIRNYLRDAAAPTRRSFQNSVLVSASRVYEQALQGAAAWAAENVPATPGKLVYFSSFD